MSEEPGGYHSWHARLLIAPGGRYRQEYLDEPSGRVIGSDGERSWVWHQQEPGPPVEVRHRPPLHQLLCPSELLGDFTLEVRGPVTACGREGIAVVATPRTGNEYVPRLNASTLSDHLEVIVDAELGILLRYEEAFAGQRLSLTELTAVVPDPPEVADLSQVRAAGWQPDQPGSGGEPAGETRHGPAWEVEKTVAGLAAGGLGAALRFAPRCPGRPALPRTASNQAMPPAEPAVLEAEGGPPPPDDLRPPVPERRPSLYGDRDEWQDLSATTASSGFDACAWATVVCYTERSCWLTPARRATCSIRAAGLARMLPAAVASSVPLVPAAESGMSCPCSLQPGRSRIRRSPRRSRRCTRAGRRRGRCRYRSATGGPVAE